MTIDSLLHYRIETGKTGNVGVYRDGSLDSVLMLPIGTDDLNHTEGALFQEWIQSGASVDTGRLVTRLLEWESSP